MNLATIIEIAGVITGVLCVYLTTKENIWSWPTGLISTTLLIIVFFNAKLYSDMLENILYTFFQIYGWWFWLHGRKLLAHQKTVPIKRLALSGWIASLSIIAVGSAALGYAMATYTDASVPYLDAFTTVMSLVAQWLLGKKILENWVLWITVDIFGIGIYAYKGLVYITGLYVIFLLLASKGLYDWIKSRNQA